MRTPKEMADWLIKNRDNPIEICNRDIKAHKDHIELGKEFKNEKMIRVNTERLKFWREVKE
jgi:hypothetical protein